MQLVGMLDSPYVRRVAISLQLLGLPFEHRSISVFRHIPQFTQINPVIKVPTLVCDDGTVLMDSTLILDYAEALAAPRSLMPRELAGRRQALRVIGLALAACEKAVQIVYEHHQRPPERRHGPWLDRITGQAKAAFAALEDEVARRPFAPAAQALDQAGVTTAVAWHFTQQMLPELAPPATHPHLQAWSEQAERRPEFLAAPHSEAVFPVRPAAAQ